MENIFIIGEIQTCPICCQNLNEDISVINICRHVFHYQCIQHYFEKYKQCCPICRRISNNISKLKLKIQICPFETLKCGKQKSQLNLEKTITKLENQNNDIVKGQKKISNIVSKKVTLQQDLDRVKIKVQMQQQEQAQIDTDIKLQQAKMEALLDQLTDIEDEIQFLQYSINTINQNISNEDILFIQLIDILQNYDKMQNQEQLQQYSKETQKIIFFIKNEELQQAIQKNNIMQLTLNQLQAELKMAKKSYENNSLIIQTEKERTKFQHHQYYRKPLQNTITQQELDQRLQERKKLIKSAFNIKRK